MVPLLVSADFHSLPKLLPNYENFRLQLRNCRGVWPLDARNAFEKLSG